MTRRACLLTAAALGAAVACSDSPVADDESGNLIVQVQYDSASGAAVDRIRIWLEGPQPSSHTLAQGESLEIDALPPGTYKVSAEGLEDSTVEWYDEASFTVVAGRTAQLTLRGRPFVPTQLAVPGGPTEKGIDLDVSWAPVVGAAEYLVEWSFEDDFTDSEAGRSNEPRFTLVPSASGLLHLRIFAESPSGARSRPLTLANPLRVDEKYPLEIIASGTGDGFVSGPELDCLVSSGAMSSDCAGRWWNNATVVLEAEAAQGSSLGEWVGCDATEGGRCTVSISGATTVGVSFHLNAELSVVAEGSGTGEVLGPGIDCRKGTDGASGDCVEFYAPGTEVALTATADPGSEVAGWSACDPIAGDGCVLVVDTSAELGVTFSRLPPRLVVRPTLVALTSPPSAGITTAEVRLSNEGGEPLTVEVTSNTSWLTAALNSDALDVGESTVVRLRASSVGLTTGTHQGLATFHLVGVADSVVLPVEFTVGDPVLYDLEIGGTGLGKGRVVGSGIHCAIDRGIPSIDCKEAYASGTFVELVAEPSGNSSFANWSGCDSSTGSQCLVEMSSDREVSAFFDPPDSVTLTISTQCWFDDQPDRATCPVEHQGGFNGYMTPLGYGITVVATPEFSPPRVSLDSIRRADTLRVAWGTRVDIDVEGTLDRFWHVRWHGPCATLRISERRCSVVLTDDEHLDMEFSYPNDVEVRFGHGTPVGGIATVRSDDAVSLPVQLGPSLGLRTWFPPRGARISLDASPLPGFVFDHWRMVGGCGESRSPTCSFIYEWTHVLSVVFRALPPSAPVLWQPDSGAAPADHGWFAWSVFEPWTDIEFDFEIDDDMDFSSPEFSRHVEHTSINLDSMGVLPAGTYHWRVRATHGLVGGNEYRYAIGPWSEPRIVIIP